MYAHSPSSQHRVWHPLADHLVRVAELAQRFAEPWGAGDLAYLVGLCHDLGKFQPELQAYLRAEHEGKRGESVPHAIWGARSAWGIA